MPMTGDDQLPPQVRDGIRTLADEMAVHGAERDAPPRAVMALLGDRWSNLIVLVLATGEWRHAELRRVLSKLSAEQAISQRVLTLKLRELERDGFVQRQVSDHVPPHVSYRLTPLGIELVDESRRLLGWINRHAGAIKAARASYDARRH